MALGVKGHMLCLFQSVKYQANTSLDFLKIPSYSFKFKVIYDAASNLDDIYLHFKLR